MEGVTEVLREQSEKGQDETGPAVANDKLPSRKDDPSIPAVMDPGGDETEPPADWLEPLEDCEDEADEGVENDRSGTRRSKRTKTAECVRITFCLYRVFRFLFTYVNRFCVFDIA